MLEKLKNKLMEIKPLAAAVDAVKVPDSVRSQRIEICQSCNFLFKPTKNCTKCGCFMEVKTWLPSASCPINKWKRHDPNTGETV
jgi:hypothetical protein